MILATSCVRTTPNDVDPELGVDPNDVEAFIVTYKTEFGETPEQIALVKGSKLLKKH